MRRLVIFRHAKAVPHGAAPDFDRALAERGEADAREAGAYLAREQILPDLALVSPSRRTRQTWEHAAPPLGDVPVRFDDAIYEARPATLLHLVRKAPASARTVALVGHNPGMAQLACDLVGHGDRYAFARMRQKFPTCGIAVVDFAVDDWSEIASDGGRLDRFVTPAGEGD